METKLPRREAAKLEQSLLTDATLAELTPPWPELVPEPPQASASGAVEAGSGIASATGACGEIAVWETACWSALAPPTASAALPPQPGRAMQLAAARAW